MINEGKNMGRREIFEELPLPSKVEEKGILNLIYKGVFITVKLLLDIRLNLVKISEGEKIRTIGNSPRKNYIKKDYKSEKKNNVSGTKVDNAVIKDTDNIEVPTHQISEKQKDQGEKNEETKS